MKPGRIKFLRRRHPARGVHFKSFDECIVFLTIKTLNRKNWLACPEAHRLLRRIWFSSTAWLVGTYLLMPNHLHLMCAPRERTYAIEEWIRYWKRKFSQLHKNRDWGFQSGGWHHRLRNDENRDHCWQYIVENPVRTGLASSTKDWPYQGKIFDI